MGASWIWPQGHSSPPLVQEMEGRAAEAMSLNRRKEMKPSEPVDDLAYTGVDCLSVIAGEGHGKK